MASYAVVWTDQELVVALVVEPGPDFQHAYQREARAWENRNVSSGLIRRAEIDDLGNAAQIKVWLLEPAGQRRMFAFESTIREDGREQMDANRRPQVWVALVRNEQDLHTVAEAIREGKAHAGALAIFVQVRPPEPAPTNSE